MTREEAVTRAKVIEGHLARYRQKSLEMEEAALKLSAELSCIRYALLKATKKERK